MRTDNPIYFLAHRFGQSCLREIIFCIFLIEIPDYQDVFIVEPVGRTGIIKTATNNHPIVNNHEFVVQLAQIISFHGEININPGIPEAMR